MALHYCQQSHQILGGNLMQLKTFNSKSKILREVEHGGNILRLNKPGHNKLSQPGFAFFRKK